MLEGKGTDTTVTPKTLGQALDWRNWPEPKSVVPLVYSGWSPNFMLDMLSTWLFVE